METKETKVRMEGEGERKEMEEEEGGRGSKVEGGEGREAGRNKGSHKGMKDTSSSLLILDPPFSMTLN